MDYNRVEKSESMRGRWENGIHISKLPFQNYSSSLEVILLHFYSIRIDKKVHVLCGVVHFLSLLSINQLSVFCFQQSMNMHIIDWRLNCPWIWLSHYGVCLCVCVFVWWNILYEGLSEALFRTTSHTYIWNALTHYLKLSRKQLKSSHTLEWENNFSAVCDSFTCMYESTPVKPEGVKSWFGWFTFAFIEQLKIQTPREDNNNKGDSTGEMSALYKSVLLYNATLMPANTADTAVLDTIRIQLWAGTMASKYRMTA